MKKIGVLFGIIFLMSFVSASLFDSISPSNLLDNEWVVFLGIFALVFALVFVSLGNFFTRKSGPSWMGEKSMQNRGAVAVISLIVALFISASVMQRGLMYGYLGEDIGSLLLLVVGLFVLIIVIKMLYKNFGRWGLAISLAGVWALFHFLGVDYLIPYSFPYEFIEIYDVVFGWVGGLILGIILLLILMRKPRLSVHH